MTLFRLATLAALGWLVVGCGVDETLAPAPPPLLPPLEPTEPGAPGPYAIGVTTLQTTDGEPGGRTLPVEVWYPAEVDPSAPVAGYALELGALVLAELDSPLGAVRDAPADRRGAPHPVVVFSHGYGGMRIQSLYLTEHLATHGFVVAAPDHIGNTFTSMTAPSEALSDFEIARLRPIDVSRTLDLLLERSATWPGLLAFMADESRVGVAGHSFGGFTAFRIAGASIDVAAAAEACEADPDHFFCGDWDPLAMPPSGRDERFLAALPQAPGGADIFGPPGEPGGFAEVAIPTMIQAGTIDYSTPFDREAAEPFAALPGEAYLLAIDGGGHFTFSNMCMLLEMLAVQLEEFDDGCSTDNIAADEAHQVINRYATAFLQARVAGYTELESFFDPDAPLPAGVDSYLAK